VALAVDRHNLRSSSAAVSAGAPGRGLTGGQQLAAGALGKRLGPHAGERGVGDTQLLARADAAVLATQPFAVHEMRPGQVNGDPAAAESLDRLAVEGLARLAVAQKRV
jgi:hypothetical protein